MSRLIAIRMLVVGLILLGAMGCKNSTQKKDTHQAAQNEWKEEGTIRYAEGFRVRQAEGFRLVDISDPEGESSATYHYALVPRGTTPEGIPDGYTPIEVPVRRLICMTALQMSHLIKLDATDRMVGMASTRFLFNEKVKQQIAEKKTQKIGIEGNFDTEKILSLNPDIILVSPFKKGGFETLKDLGFPLITFLGYKESDPLGQAEWIKFIGMLLGMEQQADSIFEGIAERYNGLKKKAESVAQRPIVMSGELHGGNWYVVGGESYLAKLFRDAGADYFMQQDSTQGGFYIDFETVFAQGSERADFWRIVNSYDGNFSYQALQDADSRYALFGAFKKKQVLYCNLRKTPFYENTPVEPEVVLADLIKIFHPELLPEHHPVYYTLLP